MHFSRLLLLSGLASAITGLVSCSNGLETVEEGSIQCEEPCQLFFQNPNLERPETSDETSLVSDGTGPIEIRSIRIEDSSPYLGFNESSRNSILGAAELDGAEGWDYIPSDIQGANFGTLVEGDPFLLQPGRNLTIELSLGPIEEGNPRCPNDDLRNCGRVVIETNDRDEDNRVITIPISIALSLGELTLSPSIIDFPTPTVGQTYEECWTATNSGAGTLAITGLSLNPAVPGLVVEQADGVPLPLNVEPGGVREFCGRWTPTTDAALNTTVTFTSNDVRGGNSSVLLRSGGGSTPILEVEPCDAIVFEGAVVGEANEVLLEVRNPAARGVLNINSLAVLSTAPADARAEIAILNALDQPVSGAQEPLEAGGNRTYKLVYTASSDRSINGVLRFSGNFDGTIRDCRFSAGPATPDIEVTPNRLYYAGNSPGDSDDRSFVIYNVGRANLTVSALSLTGPSAAEFTLDDGSTPPFDIAANSSRRVTVTYTRPADDLAADDTAQVRIEHNDPAVGPQTVFLEAVQGDQILPPTCTVTVTPGEPFTVGQTVTLSAADSVPPEGGDFVSVNPFTWTLISPSGSAARLSAPSGETTNLTFDVAGRYEVVLQGTGTVGSSTVLCESDPFNLQVVAP